MMPVMRNQNWLPSLFNDFFGDEWMGMQHKHASVPAINIIENEKDFRVELAVPGTTKEDFKVNVNADNELVISLEKRSEKEEKEGDKDKDKKVDIEEPTCGANSPTPRSSRVSRCPTT